MKQVFFGVSIVGKSQEIGTHALGDEVNRGMV